MRGGSLRKYAQLQRANMADDGAAGAVFSYALTANIYISVSTQIGRELLEAKKLNSKVTHFVTTRFRGDIKPEMRLVYGNTVLSILYAHDPTGKRRELNLICEEIVQ